MIVARRLPKPSAHRPHDSVSSTMETTELVSPIWQAAIDRYYKELEEGGMKRTPTIEKDLWEIESPTALIDEIQSMVPQETAISKVWITVLPKLEPVLLGLNDFAAVIAWSLGMNGRVAAVLWGSMKLILKVSMDEAVSSSVLLTSPVCASRVSGTNHCSRRTQKRPPKGAHI